MDIILIAALSRKLEGNGSRELVNQLHMYLLMWHLHTRAEARALQQSGLPSDEEIEREAWKQYPPTDDTERMVGSRSSRGFVRGAKWLRSRLPQGVSKEGEKLCDCKCHEWYKFERTCCDRSRQSVKGE